MAPELRRVRLVSEPARFDDYGEITSVVVSQGGEVVIEEYLDGDVSTLRNTRSCTKTVVGMLLGMAIDRGIVPGSRDAAPGAAWRTGAAGNSP